MEKQQRYAEWMLLAVAVVWGTSYGMAKQAVLFYPVVGFLFIRFLLTFVLLLPTLRLCWRQALPPGLILGSVLLAIFLCETYGVALTSASNAAFLISLCVVLTPFVEWLMFRQRPEISVFIAAAVSLCGAMLLVGGTQIAMNRGDLLVLGAALLRALMVCLTKKMTQHRNVPALALTAVQTGVVASGSLVVLLATEHGIPALPESTLFWGPTLYLVLFCTLFAFFAQNYAVKRTSPTRASLLMGSEPLFGALFAVLWLQESLTPAAWLGGLLIVAASLWATRPVKRNPGLSAVMEKTD
ncbi:MULTISPECIES: DMT family transporter [Erwinia]|uniref:Multidrug transporter n=1 Tax=Erwinia rhapontici TaxID=55212 RepID=A0ABM7N709_ERWRD|nr:EamA family transporter [Erwinia rhapontici]MBP2153336.1 drug/metabolite transporter (DMT)-like permease [Erwinia rhapontici]TDS98977.1 drug/metabolite transporter (DMT)-like permease [Erwinia rhapontici]BCQ37249.1 multidrug transporter [Erwinia rhapontici]BCQ42266.1 multidrug transporter [Erwinia rhapontici]